MFTFIWNFCFCNSDFSSKVGSQNCMSFRSHLTCSSQAWALDQSRIPHATKAFLACLRHSSIAWTDVSWATENINLWKAAWNWAQVAVPRAAQHMDSGLWSFTESPLFVRRRIKTSQSADSRPGRGGCFPCDSLGKRVVFSFLGGLCDPEGGEVR